MSLYLEKRDMDVLLSELRKEGLEYTLSFRKMINRLFENIERDQGTKFSRREHLIPPNRLFAIFVVKHRMDQQAKQKSTGKRFHLGQELNLFDLGNRNNVRDVMSLVNSMVIFKNSSEKEKRIMIEQGIENTQAVWLLEAWLRVQLGVLKKRKVREWLEGHGIPSDAAKNLNSTVCDTYTKKDSDKLGVLLSDVMSL